MNHASHNSESQGNSSELFTETHKWCQLTQEAIGDAREQLVQLDEIFGASSGSEDITGFVERINKYRGFLNRIDTYVDKKLTPRSFDNESMLKDKQAEIRGVWESFAATLAVTKKLMRAYKEYATFGLVDNYKIASSNFDDHFKAISDKYLAFNIWVTDLNFDGEDDAEA